MGRLQEHTLFPLLTEWNAPANTAHREPPHRAKIPRRARQNAPAPTTNKKPAFRRVLIVSNGGPDKDRTCDLLHAMQALSQLSYRPINYYLIIITVFCENQPENLEILS